MTKAMKESTVNVIELAVNGVSEAVAAAVVKLADFYKARRIRKGKTNRDRLNGAKAKNLQNRESRAMWQNDSKRTAQNFPYASCNGKRNRYQVTGKGNQTVILRDKK